jgi:hypothetical protein
MHQVFRGQVTPWPSAIGLSLAIHAGTLVFLGQTKWSRAVVRVQPEILEVYLSDWLPTTTSTETPPEQNPTPDAASDTDATDVETEQTGEDSRLAQADSDSDSGGQSAAEQPAPIQRSIDWQEETRRASIRMRERQLQADAYVTFGNPFSDEAPSGLKSEEGQRPNERHLPPERSSFGEITTSLGNGCYLIHGGGSILVEQAFSFSDYKLVGRTECPRPTGPRDDLFSEQKPDYLR